ncbi:hypothetical protein E4U21_006531 [Claviceps maximensis]|nr:hypothetical protein E4U21_006531 [Claviceps maximensis]
MPRKNKRGSAKTPPTRQHQQRQTTQLGELDTTPTRPEASPTLPSKRISRNEGREESSRGNTDSDIFEDGLDDGDLVRLADTQAVSNNTITKGFSWSETGSGARRSSSVSSDGPSRGPHGYLGVGNVFSSPVSGSDALPDTLPLPREIIHDRLLEDQRQTPMIVDFSETATTVLRSSPMTESRLSKSLGTSSHRDPADRVWMDDGVCQTPSQPVLVNKSKSIAVQKNESVRVPKKGLGNVLLSAESGRATDVDADDNGSAARTNNHRSVVVNLASQFMSLDGAADRHDEGAALETIHVASDEKKQKKKRKQRPKSPLRFDNDTQVVKDVFKKPVRKRTCHKIARKVFKPSPSPLQNMVQQKEATELSPRDALIDTAKCLPTTRCQSSPVETEAAMREDSLRILDQPPPNIIEDSFQHKPAELSPTSKEISIIDISEDIKVENHLASLASSGVKTRVSESNSPRTPSTTMTEIQESEATLYETVNKESTRRENLQALVQTEKEKDDECFAQTQQATFEAHSPVQQHNIPASGGLACIAASRTVYNQGGINSGAGKTNIDGKLNLAPARPSRLISVSGRGSPIRILHCGNDAVKSTSTNVRATKVWSGTGHTDCLTRPVLNDTQHKSIRSNKSPQKESTFPVMLETEPSRVVSTFGLKDHAGSFLSELKKEHANRRIVDGQTKTQPGAFADQGRQRLHELIDTCMQYLDTKKECITRIADTYAKAGDHCVEKIQSRFERESYAVIQLATQDTANFSKIVSDGKRVVERSGAKKGRLMKQFKQAVSARATSYAHASSAIDTLDNTVLTGHNTCLTSSS